MFCGAGDALETEAAVDVGCGPGGPPHGGMSLGVGEFVMRTLVIH